MMQWGIDALHGWMMQWGIDATADKKDVGSMFIDNIKNGKAVLESGIKRMMTVGDWRGMYGRSRKPARIGWVAYGDADGVRKGWMVCRGDRRTQEGDECQLDGCCMSTDCARC